jgi:hypothetical protein
MTKIAGSGSESGSISQRHGSADPDPHQNVTDPQHWNRGYGCCLVRAAYVYDRSADVAAAVAGWAERVGTGGPPTAPPPRPPADLRLLACCTTHAPRGVLHKQTRKVYNLACGRPLQALKSGRKLFLYKL